MTCIVVGIDGSATSDRVMAYATRIAKERGNCELLLVFVIEWSPYTFHTPDELAERHARREKELVQARNVVLEPLRKKVEEDGLPVRTEVRHGDPAVLVNEIAIANKADQIVIGRTGEKGLRGRLFGSVSGKLVSDASVPVTIIP